MYRDLTMSDERMLRIWLSGELPGLTLVYHHGTPAGLAPDPELVGACDRAGIGLLAVERPGYPGTTRLPGRQISDVARDTAEVLRQLGAGDVVVLGWSGGGPHALACAALLPSCRAAVSLAGIGPGPEVTGVELDAEVAQENVEEMAAARAGEATLRPWLETAAAAMTAGSPADLIDAMGDLLPVADRDVLTPPRAQRFADSTRAALADGVDGWLDDDLAFIAPWGFAVADVAVPVAVWQGDADTMVPIAHGRWLLENLPDARSHLLVGEGHLSTGYTYMDQIVADLVTLAR